MCFCKVWESNFFKVFIIIGLLFLLVKFFLRWILRKLICLLVNWFIKLLRVLVNCK